MPQTLNTPDGLRVDVASAAGITAQEPLEAPDVWQKIGYGVTRPLKNAIVPSVMLRKLLASSQSPLLAEALERPGGWRSMQLTYRNDQPVDWLDRQALRDNPVSMAARNRRRVVIDRLTQLIAEKNQQSIATPIRILGIGAGPGQHVQHAIIRGQVDPKNVRADLIDRDADAFGYGKELARQLGIHDCVNFIQGDAIEVSTILPGVQFDIVKLIGIVEYLNDEDLVAMLNVIHGTIAQDATLLTHAFIDRFRNAPFLHRVFGLQHQYRSAEHMTELLAAASFEVADCYLEPTGTYPIITARPAN